MRRQQRLKLTINGQLLTHFILPLVNSPAITSTEVTATSGTDFTPLTSIAFASTDGAEKCVSVTISNNAVAESTETFTMTISDSNVAVDSNRQATTVSIVDDDGMYDLFLCPSCL